MSASFITLCLFTQVCSVFSNKVILSSSEKKQEHKQSLVIDAYETSLTKSSENSNPFLAQCILLVGI